MSSNHFSHHGFPLHLSFTERTPATAYISLPFPFCLLLLQSFISLCSLLLFPCGNCQDWFLLWNVLHMQMLELARLGTEMKRIYFSLLSTTGGKKATWYDELEDFCAISNFNISCSSNADHSLFFPNYRFGLNYMIFRAGGRTPKKYNEQAALLRA